MERSRFSSLASLFTAVLVAAAVALGGCSNSITGATPQDQEVTVQQKAQHNQVANADDDGADTSPTAGHNTTDED